MSAPRSVRLEVLRATVQAAADARTMRTVAAVIGMSLGGLHPFLKGGQPRPATLKKLSAWYLRHAVTTGELDADLAAAAVDVLLVGIPDAEREAARARVLESVRDSYERSGAPAPEWLKGRNGKGPTIDRQPLDSLWLYRRFGGASFFLYALAESPEHLRRRWPLPGAVKHGDTPTRLGRHHILALDHGGLVAVGCHHG